MDYVFGVVSKKSLPYPEVIKGLSFIIFWVLYNLTFYILLYTPF